MDKKAFELAISTLILIIIGILVLIGVAYALTNGFKSFRDTASPFTDTTTASAVTQACQNACQQNSKIIYCCSQYEIDNNPINCTDSRLDLGCVLNCEGFACA